MPRDRIRRWRALFCSSLRLVAAHPPTGDRRPFDRRSSYRRGEEAAIIFGVGVAPGIFRVPADRSVGLDSPEEPYDLLLRCRECDSGQSRPKPTMTGTAQAGQRSFQTWARGEQDRRPAESGGCRAPNCLAVGRSSGRSPPLINLAIPDRAARGPPGKNCLGSPESTSPRSGIPAIRPSPPSSIPPTGRDRPVATCRGPEAPPER